MFHLKAQMSASWCHWSKYQWVTKVRVIICGWRISVQKPRPIQCQDRVHSFYNLFENKIWYYCICNVARALDLLFRNHKCVDYCHCWSKPSSCCWVCVILSQSVGSSNRQNSRQCHLLSNALAWVINGFTLYSEFTLKMELWSVKHQYTMWTTVYAFFKSRICFEITRQSKETCC